MLECPLYDSIRDRFLFLFENTVLGSVEFFHQLDHRVDISRLSHRGLCTLLL